MGIFASLVDIPEGRETFKARYTISAGVTIKHCELREWYTKRQTRDVSYPHDSLYRRGIRIPMDGVIRDFHNFFRICPTQYSSNLFWVVNSVARLNEKMGVALTHHDNNKVYSCQDSKDTRFYLRTRVPTVRLISCLPETNKGLDDDFLIISGDWHDGYHCPIRDGTLGRAIRGLWQFTSIL